MARPRTVADDEILAATARAIGRLGPARLTLAEAAEEAGLAPATLVQRFGSKRGLLLALSERSVDHGAAALRRARSRRSSPLGALRAGLVALAGPVSDPETFANHLAFLQLDLGDPEFHRHAKAHFDAVRDEIRALLDEAVAACELRPCDTRRLARTVQATYNGALVTWAVQGHGTLARWLRRELDAVLEPHSPRLARRTIEPR